MRVARGDLSVLSLVAMLRGWLRTDEMVGGSGIGIGTKSNVHAIVERYSRRGLGGSGLCRYRDVVLRSVRYLITRLTSL